jgi:hypothetical protein
MPASWLQCKIVLSFLIGLSFQQKDPLKDFCRRFGHQTAVVDDRLYIDGGFINYRPLEQNPLNYSSEKTMESRSEPELTLRAEQTST